MNLSEQLNFQNLIKQDFTKLQNQSQAKHLLLQSVNTFLDELYFVMIDYVHYYNALVQQSKPTSCCSFFQTHAPRQSLVILKGCDKLIISLEGKNIQARTVKPQVGSESHSQVFCFMPKQNEIGSIIWRCANDGQIVNPELIVEHYLAPFLVYGCYSTIPQQSLRLVPNYA